MIAELIARLQAECASVPDASIEHAWDSEPVEVTRDSLPRLFVFPGDEDTAGDGTNDLVSKRLSVSAHIYLVCLIEDLEDLKTEVRAAVHGWNPDAGAGYDDMELATGRLINLKGSVAWWEDVYTTWRTLREAY